MRLRDAEAIVSRGTAPICTRRSSAARARRRVTVDWRRRRRLVVTWRRWMSLRLARWRIRRASGGESGGC